VLAESGQPADAGHAVAFAGYRQDPAAPVEEDAFVGGTVADLREEGDVARVDGGDHREGFLAEAIEGAAARRGVAGAGDRAQGSRFGARRGRDAGDQEREGDPADHQPARAG
jgi:hypothetical protein